MEAAAKEKRGGEREKGCEGREITNKTTHNRVKGKNQTAAAKSGNKSNVLKNRAGPGTCVETHSREETREDKEGGKQT